MNKSIDERLAHLEQLITHLDQTVQTLNEVVVRQQRQLDTAEQVLTRLAVEVSQPRSSKDDGPPAR